MSLMFLVALALFLCTGSLFAFQSALLFLNLSTRRFLSLLENGLSFDFVAEQLQSMPRLDASSRMTLMLTSQRPRWWMYLVPFSEQTANIAIHPKQ